MLGQGDDERKVTEEASIINYQVSCILLQGVVSGWLRTSNLRVKDRTRQKKGMDIDWSRLM